MGKLSIDLLVVSTANLIQIKQDIAKDSIVALLLEAKISDPRLYQFYRDMISRDEFKDLVPCLTEKFSNNPTMTKILAIRKELCSDVQKILCDFTKTVQEDDPDSDNPKELPINTSSLYGPLFCRLKRLEQFLGRLS